MRSSTNWQHGGSTLSHGLCLSRESLDICSSIASFLTFVVSSDPGIANLDIESNELTKAWALFREKIPTEQRVQFAERPQEIGDIVALVHQMDDKWKSDTQKGVSGHIKLVFHRFCSGLDSHSNLLSVLPSSSHYVSILSGTLQTVIKVISMCLMLALSSTSYDFRTGLEEL